jgi:hypothetical protein
MKSHRTLRARALKAWATRRKRERARRPCWRIASLHSRALAWSSSIPATPAMVVRVCG